MIEPRLTERAEADLEEIWLHVANHSSDAADRIVDSILKQSRAHVSFPSMGQRRDELQPALRSFVVGSYVVYYRVAEPTIEVIRVLHGARDVKPLFPSEG